MSTSVNKARAADQNQIQPGTVGPVERKLLELGEVRGIVSGNFGEVSQHTHNLVAALATCRVRRRVKDLWQYLPLDVR